MLNMPATARGMHDGVSKGDQREERSQYRGVDRTSKHRGQVSKGSTVLLAARSHSLSDRLSRSHCVVPVNRDCPEKRPERAPTRLHPEPNWYATTKPSSTAHHDVAAIAMTVQVGRW